MNPVSFTRIDHVHLAMPEGRENSARKFFGELLGMTELEKPEPLASRGGCWFQMNQVVVHLGVDKDFKAAGKAHPAFCVSDVDALARHLERAGCLAEWDEALPDRRRFYTKDPFGNRIEFVADGDVFTQK